MTVLCCECAKCFDEECADMECPTCGCHDEAEGEPDPTLDSLRNEWE